MTKRFSCLVGIFLLLSCGGKQPQIDRIYEDGVEVVLNHVEPYLLPGVPSALKLEEDFSIDTEGNGLQQLTFDAGAHESPSWSPDGSKIIYDSIVPYNPTPGVPDYYSRGLFTIHPDGTGRTALPVTGPLQNACVPVWSPDGTRIAFSTTRYPPQEIYIVNADGSGLIQLTNTDTTLGLSRGNYKPSWGLGS